MWGPPPANVDASTSRTVEGITLADYGPQPVSKPGTSPPPYSSSLPVAPGRTSSKEKATQGTSTSTPMPTPTPLTDRRSIDSLFSSMDLPGPLASTSHERRFSTMRAGAPQRSASCKVKGHSATISSTTRAKPARESVIPLHQSSPYNGYWTTGRSSSTDEEWETEEGYRMREKFKNCKSVWTVSRGWKKGIFSSFEEAEQQTRGFPGPVIRQFNTVDEAMRFLKTSLSQPGQTKATAEENGAPLNKPMLRQSSDTSATKENVRQRLKSPQTNPFLVESHAPETHAHANGSLSPASALFSSPYLSPKHSPRRGEGDRSRGRAASSSPMPLPPRSSSQLERKRTNELGIGVTTTSLVVCQDLDKSVAFYCDVLRFRVLEDQRGLGQVMLGVLDSHRPCLLLRSAIAQPTSHRSTVVVDQGHCDMAGLYAETARSVLHFESTTSGVQRGACRVDGVQVKVRMRSPLLPVLGTHPPSHPRQPWGSLEFAVTDVDGNTVAFSGTQAATTPFDPVGTPLVSFNQFPSTLNFKSL